MTNQTCKGSAGATERFQQRLKWWSNQFQLPEIVSRQQRRRAERQMEKAKLREEKAKRLNSRLV